MWSCGCREDKLGKVSNIEKKQKFFILETVNIF